MTPTGQTICLCMIVKDEAHVVARCLASARPLVDSWVVVDTGSTDGTQDVVRAAMAGLPGELVERPWVDFGHNRSEALALARPHADYSIVIDADDLFEVPANFALPVLDKDSYVVDIKDGGITYQRTQLFKNALPWRYAGVLHEFPTCDGADGVGHLAVVMRRNHDGRRRRTSDTYQNDAAILARALERETDPFFIARYTFYLAQSWRDCGRLQDSLDAYLRRAEMGHWQEEVFVSLYQAGHRMEALGRPADEILAVYARASAAAPSRAEAAHAASKLCRVLGRNAQGAEMAAPALGLAPPGDGLFVEPWIYEYGLRDEFSVNAYWSKRYSEALEQTLAALASGTVPAGEQARFVANARFAFDAMAREGAPVTAAAAKPVAGGDTLLWAGGATSPDVALPGPFVGVSRRQSDLVSIITPTYGRKDFLATALTYVQSQSHDAIEWLILDDSPERADIDFGSDPRVSYQHVAGRLTIGEKRNLLVERARGATIAQFDDDDYYAPRYLDAMLASMTRLEADLVNLRGWFLFDRRSQFFGYWDLMRKEGLHYRCDADGVTTTMLDAASNQAFARNHLGFGFSYLFKKEVWEAGHFPSIDWNEDGEFVRVAEDRFKVAGFHDTTGLCLHYLHQGSTSRCFPQHHLPRFLGRQLFPELAETALFA